MRGDGTAATALAFCSAALGWSLFHGAPPASAGLPPLSAEAQGPAVRDARRSVAPLSAPAAPAPEVAAERRLPAPAAHEGAGARAVAERSSSLAPLLAQLRDPDSFQRELAVRALGDQAEATAVPLLAYALADTEPAVVLAAIDVVQGRREFEVLDDLYLLLDHADGDVRRRASNAIRSLE
jgi:hypothetical protein